jgi:3-hydroxy-3-methylglutaryl CoA synthase
MESSQFSATSVHSTTATSFTAKKLKKVFIFEFTEGLDLIIKFCVVNPGSKVQLSSFNAFLFHSPYCKLVQKSLARLLLNDFVMASPEEKSKFPPAFEAFK